MNDSPVAAVDPHERSWLWRGLQFVFQNIFVFWLRYRVAGKEHLPEGGALLLVNHQSMLDPLLAGASLKRPISFLARHELFSVPVIGWILKNTYVMSIRRESAGSESIRRCVERLNQGYYVGLFPEGTRSDDGRLGEIKPGFLAIVRRTQTPVIPVGVAGGKDAYPRGSILIRSATVRVVFGPPIPLDLVQGRMDAETQAQFLQLVHDRMAECLKQAEDWRQGIGPGESDGPPQSLSLDQDCSASSVVGSVS